MKPRIQNSQVRVSTLETLHSFFVDLSLHHPHLKKELERDLRTISKRYSEEGVQFLTVTLPSLGKAIYRSFESKVFSTPLGFRKQRKSTLPLFLRGLWNSVYEADGSFLKDLDSSSLVDLIQLTFLFYKLELPSDLRREKKVIQNFIDTEIELKELRILNDDPILFEAQDLIGKHFSKINLDELKPKHGPGCVATGEKFESKWSFKRKYLDIHRVFPYYEYFVPSRNALLDSISTYKALEVIESGVAKVSLVPKDSRGPRLISMEPLEYQFIQQSLKCALYDYIEQKCPFTRGYVNFTDQTINRQLAYKNSLSREYATLDMKDASDRVSLQLVEILFAKAPELLRALKATRTKHTKLPDGTVLPLAKFAPMGSALCFPVEALVFYTLAKAIKNQKRIYGDIYVYGDDLIVPRKLAISLFELFPKYGLKFNEDKCFIDGYFRESCGLDAYKGIICTPIRMKHLVPKSTKNASAIVSAVDLSNLLYQKGYWRTAAHLQRMIPLKRLPVTPVGSERFSFLSYRSFSVTSESLKGLGNSRWNHDYQRHEYKLWQLRLKTKVNKLNSWPRLFMNLLDQHIGKYAVPHAAALKLRWLPIYG